METKNRILIDWFTFTTRKETLQTIFNVIGIDFDNFVKLDKGCKGYKSRYYLKVLQLLMMVLFGLMIKE